MDPLTERAEEIVDVWTSHLGSDEQIGRDRYLLKRSDLVHLVLATLEIALRRVAGGIREQIKAGKK